MVQAAAEILLHDVLISTDGVIGIYFLPRSRREEGGSPGGAGRMGSSQYEDFLSTQIANVDILF
jgi:hypothetical protein